MRSLRSIIFMIGLIFIIIGSVFLITGIQSPNMLSKLFGTIFTISGILINYLQLFIPFPLFHFNSQLNGPSNSRLSNAPNIAKSHTWPSTKFFLFSCITLFFGGISNITQALIVQLHTWFPSLHSDTDIIVEIYIFMAAFILPSMPLMARKIKQSRQASQLDLSGLIIISGFNLLYVGFLLLVIFSLNGLINPNIIGLIQGLPYLLYSLGLPAIQIKQAHQTPRLGLFGVVIICAGNLLLIILLFIANYNTNQSYDLLFRISLALTNIGYFLFGIAIIRASIFPRWIGILFIISATTFSVGFIPNDYSNIIQTQILSYIFLFSIIIEAYQFIACGYKLINVNQDMISTFI